MIYDSTDVGPRRRVITATDLIVIPLHRWRIVVAFALAGLLAAAGYQWLVPATYTGTSLVVVRPVVTDPFAYPSSGADRAVNMNAESGIAAGNEVIAKISAETGRSLAQVRDRLTVEAPVGGQVLRFIYRGRSADEAIRAANVAADSYLQVRRSAYQAQRDALLKSYDSTIAALNQQRAEVVRQLPANGNGNNPTPGVTAALDQLRALDDQLAQLSQQRARVLAIDMTPGSVTQTAAGPLPSTHDGTLLILLAGLLGGALAGGLAAFVRESTDRRLRSATEVAEVVGVPILGAVRRPAIGRGRSRTAADAAYVALALTETIAREGLRPLVLLSAADDEGRTTLVADLAVALARDGRAVYVVDAADHGAELRNRIGELQFAPAPVAVPQPARSVATEPVPAAVPPARRPAEPLAVAPRGVSIGDTLRIPRVTLDGELPEAARPRALALVGEDDRTDDAESDEPDSGALGRAPAAPRSLAVEPGSVLVGDAHAVPPGAVVLVDAPAADSDEGGVRAARDATAVLVVARHRTRDAQLRRLVERLASAGAQPVGFVLTRSGRV